MSETKTLDQSLAELTDQLVVAAGNYKAGLVDAGFSIGTAESIVLDFLRTLHDSTMSPVAELFFQ